MVACSSKKVVLFARWFSGVAILSRSGEWIRILKIESWNSVVRWPRVVRHGVESEMDATPPPVGILGEGLLGREHRAQAARRSARQHTVRQRRRLRTSWGAWRRQDRAARVRGGGGPRVSDRFGRTASKGKWSSRTQPFSSCALRSSSSWSAFPSPQSDALGVAFGLSAGPCPEPLSGRTSRPRTTGRGSRGAAAPLLRR